MQKAIPTYIGMAFFNVLNAIKITFLAEGLRLLNAGKW